MADKLATWADLSVSRKCRSGASGSCPPAGCSPPKEPESPTATPRRKARLVARGFEDPDKDTVDSTSPTAARATLWVLFSALASRGFLPRTIDMRTAFVQGMPLDRLAAVYVQPSPQSGAPVGVVWRLLECAYGLTDAPRR